MGKHQSLVQEQELKLRTIGPKHRAKLTHNHASRLCDSVLGSSRTAQSDHPLLAKLQAAVNPRPCLLKRLQSSSELRKDIAQELCRHPRSFMTVARPGVEHLPETQLRA